MSRVAVLRQRPAFGRLWLRPANMERFDKHAKIADLLGADGTSTLRTLVNAQVAKIDMGIHVTGTEGVPRGGYKSKIDQYRQSWLGAATIEELSRLINLIPAPIDADGNVVDEDDLPF